MQNRILFHVAHRQGDETQLINYHQRLTNSVEDQLSLAGMHFLRGHYQEATDLYKRILLEQASQQTRSRSRLHATQSPTQRAIRSPLHG